jgi:adenosylcobinamide-phosphate synthase
VITPVNLVCAFFLDLAIGDPRWLPHPVRIIGKGIEATERRLRGCFNDRHEKAAGVLLVCAIVLPATFIAFVAGRLLLSFSAPPLTVIGAFVFIYLVSTTLALRGLISSARHVIAAVREKSLHVARQRLAMIVGRDTGELGEKAILAATIETLAENLSDGFVAPLLYLVVGGLPLAVAYKAVNTLDSIVGYKNVRYIRFGWAAARLDDAANYIPARITGLILAPAAFCCALTGGVSHAFHVAHRSFAIMRRDGKNHTSPNSGIPEAAMAGALGVRLGGPSAYGGTIVEKPFIGDGVTVDYLRSADSAVFLAAWAASLTVALALLCLLALSRKL